MTFISCKKEDKTTEQPIKENYEILILSSDDPGSVGVSILDGINKDLNNIYTVITGDADDNMMDIVNGDYDIAVLPIDMANYLYNRSEKGSYILGITHFAEISLLSNQNDELVFSDINGKDVITCSDNMISKTVFDILAKNEGISYNNISIYSYNELDDVITENPNALILSDEPYTTDILTDNSTLKSAMDVTAEWKSYNGSDNNIPAEVICVNKKFADANPEAIDFFVEDMKTVLSDIDKHYKYVEEKGIMPEINHYDTAVINSSLVFINSEKSFNEAEQTLNKIFDECPEFLHGNPHDKNIYYIKKQD
ncbi:MAG: hypothetical protein E7652_00665 [Ruminococcaceae bacterium]|nr:hypothetical protein [Oscillospiraceae bacterium]